MLSKSHLALILTLVVTPFSTPMAFSADPGIRASAEISSFPGNLENQHRARAFEVSATFNNPDLVTFSATFAGDISANSFMPAGNATPTMKVKIFYSQPGSGADYSNITIETPKVPYQNDTKIDAISTNSCGAKTWMNKGAGIVYFEINRNCYDLPDKFYSALYVDSDLNKSGAVDYVYLPASSSLTIDITKIPKPAKVLPKKDQVIAGYPAQQSYTLDVATAYFSTSTNSGLPIQIIGKTSTVCAVTSSTTISLTGTGTCVVALSAPGNDLWNPSPEVSFSFNVLPKKVIPKVDQNLYFNRPGTLYENSGEQRLDIYTDTKLEVKVVSSTPDVCLFPYSAPDNTVVKVYRSGTCAFTVSQAGNERYNPSQGSTSIEIYAVAKPAPAKTGTKPAPAPTPEKPKAPQGLQILSGSSSTSGGSKAGASAANGGNVLKFGEKKIICRNGTKTVTVTKKNPTCPKGYTEKK
jgi:hypothetical protein